MNTYNNKYDILGSTIKPNPASVKYWADLASNPYGGDLKYFNGKEWVLVNNKLLDQVKLDVTDIPNAEALYSYGVSWQSGSLNPVLTRIGNLDLHRSLPIQNKMRGCTLADDGTVNHYFNSDWTANEDGTTIVKDGDSTHYECEQVIINESSVNDDSIIRKVLIDNWDVNYQLKMLNDYFAFQLGLTEDENCKKRYEDFLDFRAKLKASVAKSII